MKLLTNVLCPQIFQSFVIYLIPFPYNSIQFKKQAQMFKGHFVLRITNKLYNLFKQSRQLNGFAVRRLIRVKLLISVT